MMISARELDRYKQTAPIFGEEGHESPNNALIFIAGTEKPASIEYRVAALNVHRIFSRAAAENGPRQGSAGSR